MCDQAKALICGRRVLVLAGEGTCESLEEAREVAAWAKAYGLPLLADPLSGLRSLGDETVIDNYDSLGREQKIKLLSEACADAQWLNRMVENLLSVTRIDADGVAIQKTPTVLEELVDTVLVRFQKLHPGVPVEVKLPDDFIVIPMDSMLIQQVLTNLLENAVLHAKGMTRLTLRVFTLGQRAVFEVIDNGCGIPKERLKTLFTGTTLTQDTSSGGKHGMGIGLSVCAAIIKAHGGEIQADSRVGEGTTIRFWLEKEEIELEDAEDEQ